MLLTLPRTLVLKDTTMHVKYVHNNVSSIFEPFTFAVGHLQKLTYGGAWFISNLS